MTPSLDELVAKLDELPPLSDTPSRLSEAIAHPASSVEMLAKVIERDATLTQRVLKLANSAFYSVPGGVDTVKRAVMFVGISSVHQIALYVSSMAILNQRRAIPVWLMRHAGAVATLGRHMAVERKMPNADAVLVAGLLHDLGWLALQALFPDLCVRYANEVRKGAVHGRELEQSVLGITHEAVGARLAAKWKFPPALVQLVGGHHGSVAPEGQAAQMMTDLIAVADVWAWELGRPGLAPPQKPVAKADPGAFSRLKVLEVPTPEHRKALELLLEQESLLT